MKQNERELDMTSESDEREERGGPLFPVQVQSEEEREEIGDSTGFLLDEERLKANQARNLRHILNEGA